MTLDGVTPLGSWGRGVRRHQEDDSGRRRHQEDEGPSEFALVKPERDKLWLAKMEAVAMAARSGQRPRRLEGRARRAAGEVGVGCRLKQDGFVGDFTGWR